LSVLDQLKILSDLFPETCAVCSGAHFTQVKETEMTQITCVNKQPRNDIHKQIENVGGSGWRITQDEAIRKIENGESYEVSVNGRTVSVVVAEHEGNKYIKTAADGYAENNLLSLPEC
jgi:hypothetical protein